MAASDCRDSRDIKTQLTDRVPIQIRLAFVSRESFDTFTHKMARESSAP